MKENEHFDFCMCNPPFHSYTNVTSSDEEKNSDRGEIFELYTAGGEVDFIKKIIVESERLQNSIR